MSDRSDILFAIAVLGFFGVTGLDLMNALSTLVAKLGNAIFFVLLIAWALMNKK